MFCTECGSKNKADAKFCFQCGQPLVRSSKVSAPKVKTVEPTSIYAPAPSAKKSMPLWLKISLFAGAPFLVIVAIGAVFVLFKPMPTYETADQFLLTRADVANLDLSRTDPIDQQDRGADFIYGQCSARSELTSSVKLGHDWASNAFEAKNSSDGQTYLISSQIIEFDTTQEAQDVIDIAVDASSDPECDTTLIDDYYSGGGKLVDDYKVDLIGTDLINEYSGDQSRLVFARRGKVLLIIQTKVTDGNSQVSNSENVRQITRALNLFAGNR